MAKASNSPGANERPSSIPDDLHATVAANLRSAKQRYSTGRRAIVEVLAGSGRPVTAPELVMINPALSVSSVYRNLAVLEQVGVVRRLVTHEENARYELAEEFSQHHDHLICEGCGIVTDYLPPPTLEQAMGRALVSIKRSDGFTPRAHHLQILGLCARCARVQSV